MKKWIWWVVGAVVIFMAWRYFAPKGTSATPAARRARSSARRS